MIKKTSKGIINKGILLLFIALVILAVPFIMSGFSNLPLLLESTGSETHFINSSWSSKGTLYNLTETDNSLSLASGFDSGKFVSNDLDVKNYRFNLSKVTSSLSPGVGTVYLSVDNKTSDLTNQSTYLINKTFDKIYSFEVKFEK